VTGFELNDERQIRFQEATDEIYKIVKKHCLNYLEGYAMLTLLIEAYARQYDIRWTIKTSAPCKAD
jgi:hypothetical protein